MEKNGNYCDFLIESPKIFRLNIVRKIKTPGNTIIHHASTCMRPAFKIDPQVTMLSGTPIPKNDKLLSISSEIVENKEKLE